MSTYPYFTPQSDEQRVRHLARESEQARRDITNLQRRLNQDLGDVIPVGDDAATQTGFAVGTMGASIARGETGKAFTVVYGDSDCTLVGDYNSQIPQYISLPSGTKLSAHKVDSVWVIDPPGDIYMLTGTCAAIAASSSGSVSTSLGTLTSVSNGSASAALAGWCVAAAKRDGSWYLVNFNPDCPA